MNRLKSLLYGGLIGALMGTFFYLIPTNLLLTGAIHIKGPLLPPGVREAILMDTVHVGSPIGACIGLLFGLMTVIPRPPRVLSTMIGLTSLVITWVVSFTRFGSNLKDFSAGHIIIFVFWLIGGIFLALPGLTVILGKYEPSDCLLRPPATIEE